MTKHNLFIIHGAFGGPNENWFPWLKEEVEKLGIEAFIPTFPTPEGQSLTTWNDAFRPYEKHITEKSIFVGHSLGPAFILNLLERTERKIAASFLVAPYTGLLNIPEFDEVNFTLTDRNFDWERIKDHCKQFYVYHSDNDPYVPKSNSEFIARKLGAHRYEIKGGLHLNASAGFNEFPMLLDHIKTKFLTNA